MRRKMLSDESSAYFHYTKAPQNVLVMTIHLRIAPGDKSKIPFAATPTMISEFIGLSRLQKTLGQHLMMHFEGHHLSPKIIDIF